jgi:hypothetical protein
MARAAFALLVAAALVAIPDAKSESDPARAFLTTAFGLTRSDLARVDSGKVFSRTLDAKHSREVATLGIVRIRTTPAVYVERLTDIVKFKRNEAVLQIGTFSHPPRQDDVAALTLEAADVRRLRDCRVGDCGVQLSVDAIERFRREVNWQGADVEREATSVMQRVLLEYVKTYLEVGSAAAMEYADRPTRLHVGREFGDLLASDSFMSTYFPGLREHLRNYPTTRDERRIDRVYWSKELVNRRPVISVTHLTIERAEKESPAEYAVTSKHIYGMHYFDASLGLTVLLRDRTAPTPATYVVYLNRSRVDLFKGMFGAIARKAVSGRARGLVADLLARLQRSLDGTADAH